MEFHSDNANYKTDINLNFLENYSGNRNSVWSESDNIKIISDFLKEVDNKSKGLENSLSSDEIVLQETYNDILLYINSDIENEIDIAFISESWERPNEPLSEVIKMENYSVISNPHQRQGQGGRPALVINNALFDDFNTLSQSFPPPPVSGSIIRQINM